MLSQLPDGVRAHFPVILTRKYACDRAVIGLFRSRTLGNSSTALRNNLQEVHCEEWLRKQLCYLTDCERYRKGLQGLFATNDIQGATAISAFSDSQVSRGIALLHCTDEAETAKKGCLQLQYYFEHTFLLILVTL